MTGDAAGNVVATSFSGSGASLTALTAANLVGQVPLGSLSNKVLQTTGNQIGTNLMLSPSAAVVIGSSNALQINSTGNVMVVGIPYTNGPVRIPGTAVIGTVMATTVTGDGSGMTALAAGNISSGSLADARLSSKVMITNDATGIVNFGSLGVGTTANATSGSIQSASQTNSGNIQSATLNTTGAATFTGAVVGGSTATWTGETVNGYVSARAYGAQTNAWTVDTPLGATNAIVSVGAVTFGIPALNTAIFTSGTRGYAAIEVLTTGAATFTNALGFHASDLLSTRALASGRFVTIEIDYWPGATTNIDIVQH